MEYLELKKEIRTESFLNKLKYLKVNDCEAEIKRYESLIDKAFEIFKDGDYHFVSSPGRSEIGGNHTDHQLGKVVACSLNIDNIAVFKANGTNIINYVDDKFGAVKVDLTNLEYSKQEENTSASLIRGIAFKLKEMGYNIAGFDACSDSKVLIGSGISSSACFEVMIVEIFNHLFNENKIKDTLRAIISQFSENVYFGKPSGLLDQMAISVGGFVSIDFINKDNPEIENFAFSFADYGYELLLINTKGNHANLSNEYASIPSEMKLVADKLNVPYLGLANKKAFLENLKEIRQDINNDRAILRALHFFEENDRAQKQKEALKNNDIKELLKLMKESGESSYGSLQNVYVSSNPNSQSLALGIKLTNDFIEEDGIVRVHGGGFEGTIQVVLKKEIAEDYKKFIGNIFGEDSILAVEARPKGTITLI